MLLHRRDEVRNVRRHWREFEILLRRVFESQGFRAERVGGDGADGGVDVILRKGHLVVLVQCNSLKVLLSSRTDEFHLLVPPEYPSFDANVHTNTDHIICKMCDELTFLAVRKRTNRTTTVRMLQSSQLWSERCIRY